MSILLKWNVIARKKVNSQNDYKVKDNFDWSEIYMRNIEIIKQKRNELSSLRKSAVEKRHELQGEIAWKDLSDDNKRLWMSLTDAIAGYLYQINTLNFILNEDVELMNPLWRYKSLTECDEDK